MLGLVEVIGRPVLMLYPAYLLSAEILRLASKLGLLESLEASVATATAAAGSPNSNNHTQRQGGRSRGRGQGPDWTQVSAQDIVSVLRLVVMCCAVNQALALLTAYTSLGYSCLGLGLGALALASNDALLKQYVPVIAPHAVSAHAMIEQVSRMEGTALGGSLAGWMGAVPSQTQASSSSSSSFPSSPRVEVLGPNTVPLGLPVATAVPVPVPVSVSLSAGSVRTPVAGALSSASSPAASAGATGRGAQDTPLAQVISAEEWVHVEGEAEGEAEGEGWAGGLRQRRAAGVGSAATPS